MFPILAQIAAQPVSQLTPSEEAIVDEIVSAKSVEELVLLGQRLDFLHAFSNYALLVVIGFALIMTFHVIKFPRLKLLAELATSIVFLVLPSIPFRLPDGSLQQLPLFFILGIAGTIVYGLSFLKSLFFTPSDDSEVTDDEEVQAEVTQEESAPPTTLVNPDEPTSKQG